MSRRTRRPDASSLGRSERVPFTPGELAADRHARRLDAAVRDRAQLEEWLAARGMHLRVGNDFQHWEIRRESGATVLDWWPSTAKAVVGRRWGSGVHCHDTDQLRRLIAARLPGFDGAGR